MNPDIRYLYNAHGAGLGGHIRLPFDEIIQVQAPGALPISGGYSSTRVDNFSFKGILTASAIYTEVAGSYSAEKDSFGTSVTTTIEKFNLLNVVTADRIVARLTSRHPASQATDAIVEAEIIPLGSHFENLRIAGQLIDVTLDVQTFCDNPTHSARCAAGIGTMQYGVLVGSLVKSGCDNVIKVPQFGRVELAQIISKDRVLRLTMLQIDLGCSIEGSATAGCVESNGGPIKP